MTTSKTLHLQNIIIAPPIVRNKDSCKCIKLHLPIHKHNKSYKLKFYNHLVGIIFLLVFIFLIQLQLKGYKFSNMLLGVLNSSQVLQHFYLHMPLTCKPNMF